MRAPLKPPILVPIYALSGFPHPDKPPIPEGLAAVIEAEDARLTPSGPAPPASPQPAAFPSRARGLEAARILSDFRVSG